MGAVLLMRIRIAIAARAAATRWTAADQRRDRHPLEVCDALAYAHNRALSTGRKLQRIVLGRHAMVTDLEWLERERASEQEALTMRVASSARRRTWHRAIVAALPTAIGLTSTRWE